MLVRRIITFFILLVAQPVSAAVTPFSIGLALESRLNKEVNPDVSKVDNVPQLSARYRFEPFAVQLEYSQQASSSGSGSLRINSLSRLATLWGRYKYYEYTRWNPFVGAGFGYYFDRVESKFEGSANTRGGQRRVLGLGTGIGTPQFWETLDLEGEMRISTVEQRSDPMFSFLLRLDVQI